MLNYANLNDTEFEFLCKDIMSKKLNVELRAFAQGRDGGIDLCNEDKSIIVQVKHYTESTTASLVKSLKRELVKVKELKPQEYYICCSKKLTKNSITELYTHFSQYMSSENNIVTLIEVDDFLTDKNNCDVLEKHYKLWIVSTNILSKILHQDIFIDCEYLLSTINEDKKYFVQTTAYNKALEYLKNEKVLMLIGEPGVGKTTTSKMLILHYASIGYKVRFTTDVADVSSLKRVLSQSREQKEIVLLDDCFGLAYFDMKSTQCKELLALIRYVKLNENKILLLNSRITIYQEAQNKTPDLISSIDKKEFKVHIIDMTNLKKIEKAKILYNHLYFNTENKLLFDAIKKNGNYLTIIEHQNYSPRIIEYISNSKNYENIQPENYFSTMLETLKNPSKIWDDEYEENLQDADRCLIMTIYSLTNTSIDFELAKKCFYERIKKIHNIDSTIDQFNKSLSRLLNSFLRITDYSGTKLISIANPSITDYLRGKLESNPLEREAVLSAACNTEQLARLLDKNNFDLKIKELFDSGKICNLIFESEEIKADYITAYIAEHKIKNLIYKDYIYSYLKNPNTGSLFRVWKSAHYMVLPNLFSSDLIESYNLVEYLDDLSLLEEIFIKSDFEEIHILTQVMYESFKHIKGFNELCIKYLKLKIEKHCDFIEVENYDLEAENFLIKNEYYNSETDPPEEIYDEYKSGEAIEKEVEEIEKDKILNILRDSPYQECKDWFLNSPPKFHVYDGIYMIRDFFAENLVDPEPMILESSIDEIDLMFNR